MKAAEARLPKEAVKQCKSFCWTALPWHRVFSVGESHGKRGEVWESIIPRLMVFRPRLPALSAPFLLDQQVSVLIFSSKDKFLLHRSAGAAGTGGSTKTPRLCICKHKPVPGRGSLGQLREGHVCALCHQPSSFGQAISQRCCADKTHNVAVQMGRSEALQKVPTDKCCSQANDGRMMVAASGEEGICSCITGERNQPSFRFLALGFGFSF